MASSRALTAAAGVIASIAVSLAAWHYFETLLLFLFVPFVPILLRGSARGEAGDRAVRTCPACGFRTADPEHDYCPRDGTNLE